MIPVDALLGDIPKLHSWDGGQSWNPGGFGPAELGWLIAAVAERFGAGSHIAETGCGCSTLAFLMTAPDRVHSISFDTDVVDRLRDYATRNAIPLLPLEIHAAQSERVVPASRRGL